MTACLHVHKSHGQNHGCRHGHRHECGQSQGLHHTGSAQEAQWHCWRRLPSSLSTCRELLTEAPHTSSVQCSRVDGLDARVASDHLGWVIASMLGAHLHLHYSKHPRSIWSSSLCQWPQRPLWRSPHLRIVAGATGHRLRTCPLPRRRQQACSIWQCAGCPVCSAGQASLLTLKVSPLLTTILGAAPVVGMHCHLEAQNDLPGPSSSCMQPASEQPGLTSIVITPVDCVVVGLKCLHSSRGEAGTLSWGRLQQSGEYG